MVKSWIIFVGADENEAAAYEKALRERNVPFYDDMISHDFIFAFWPGIKSFSLLNGLASVLRAVYPKDLFLFAFPHEWKEDFKAHAIEKYGERPATRSIGGYADIPRGVGFATRHPLTNAGAVSAIGAQTIKHELAHLQNCGTWHDEVQGFLTHPLCGDCVIIRKIDGSDKLPWCQEVK